MRAKRFPLVGLILFVFVAAKPGGAEEIRVRSVLTTLIDDVNIPAREAGVLAEVKVRVGDLVKSGDELARINDERARLTVRKFEVERQIAAERSRDETKVRYAEKTREVAVAELNRAEESIQRFPGSISDSQLDALRLGVARAEADRELQKQELKIAALTEKLKGTEVEAAKDDVARRRIVSTVNGTVVEVQSKPGEWVEPGERVFRVVRTDTLRVKGFIKAGEAHNGLKGRPVRVKLEGIARPVTGRLTSVSPLIDPDNGEVAVAAEIPNPEGALRPGLRGEMIIAESPRGTSKSESRIPK